MQRDKNSSKDIDFILSCSDFRAISDFLVHLKLDEGIITDVFIDGEMSRGYRIADYESRSIHFNSSFKNINVFYLDDVTLAVTKAIAGRDQDYIDLEAIRGKITKDDFQRRFEQLSLDPTSADGIKEKIVKFIDKFYGDY